MRLDARLERLEAKHAPHPIRVVTLHRYEGQTQEQAIAAHEAEHGPVGDKALCVIIRKPFPVPVVVGLAEPRLSA